MSEKAKNKNISVTIVVDEEILTIKMAKNENILEACKNDQANIIEGLFTSALGPLLTSFNC